MSSGGLRRDFMETASARSEPGADDWALRFDMGRGILGRMCCGSLLATCISVGTVCVKVVDIAMGHLKGRGRGDLRRSWPGSSWDPRHGLPKV